MVELVVALVVVLAVFFVAFRELRQKRRSLDRFLVSFSALCLVAGVMFMACWRENYFFLPTALFLIGLSLVGGGVLAYYRVQTLEGD